MMVTDRRSGGVTMNRNEIKQAERKARRAPTEKKLNRVATQSQ